MRTPTGFTLFTLLSASVIMVMEIRNIVRELRKQEQASKEPRKNGD